MIFEYALLTVSPDDMPAFEATFPAATSILLSSAGCGDVTFETSVHEPGVYLMKVGWDSVADHLEAFASSPAAAELAEVFGRFFSSAPVVAHFAR